MEERLEIGGVEYIFTCNRRAALQLSKMQGDMKNIHKNGDNVPLDMLDKMAYAFLLAKQPDITMEKVSELLDQMEQEYGLTQTIEFLNKFGEEVFTQANEEQKDKYKVIPFLARKNKN